MSPRPAMDLSEYVSGGYFITLPARRAEHMDAALLPDTILTASGCIVDLVPDTWSIVGGVATRLKLRLDEALWRAQQRELHSEKAHGRRRCSSGWLHSLE
ncbi:MAG: hypothetical protein V2A73_13435 [Pseudomonadota bacterium]